MATRDYSTFGADPNALRDYRSTTPWQVATTPVYSNIATTGSAKESLDNVVSEYTGTSGISSKDEQARTALRGRAGDVRAAAATGSAYDPLAGLDLYETTGGANIGLINALTASRAQLAENYATNRADAENMYGALSMDASVPSTGLIGDIQSMGGTLQGAYDMQIQGSQDTAAARQTALSEEQMRQQANREKVAASLGLAPESVQMNYASDEALNTGMSTVADRATSWEGLLNTNKLGAMESTNRLITGAANTKNQTILGMKAYLDSQQAQIDAEVAMEKAKTPQTKLTALGKLIEARTNQGIVDQIFGNEDLTPRGQDEADAMRDLGLDRTNPNDMQYFRQLQASGSEKLKNSSIPGASEPLTTAEQIAVKSQGIPLSYFNPDYNNLANQ